MSITSFELQTMLHEVAQEVKDRHAQNQLGVGLHQERVGDQCGQIGQSLKQASGTDVPPYERVVA